MRKIRTYNEVDPGAGRELVEQVLAQRARLAERLSGVGALVAVASGKGGVGKSALTANLAVALARAGWRVGAVDADLNGPSLARMLGAAGARLTDGEGGVGPAHGAAGVALVSMELLQEAEDAPLRWKGPHAHASLWQGVAEAGALREFLSDVAWGETDFLLVDVPPGVDRIQRLLELAPPALTLLVSTPSEISRRVVARSARYVREQGLAAGLVINMSEHHCAACGHASPLYGADAAAALAAESGLEVWARVPFEPALADATDSGRPWVLEAPASPSGRALAELAGRVANALAPGAGLVHATGGPA